MSIFRRLRRFGGVVWCATRQLVGPSWRRTPNLLGDRCVEWGWVAATLPSGPGVLMDFGCGESFTSLAAAERGFEVTAMDLMPSCLPYTHPSIQFVEGDILKMSLTPECFDVIINCSAIEHVGLAGRYGVTAQRADGDLEAMAALRPLLRREGLMILTVPVGQDAVFSPNCRVYGADRLPRLLAGFSVERQEFWVKDAGDHWMTVPREVALQTVPRAEGLSSEQTYYGLGCFTLRPSEE